MHCYRKTVEDGQALFTVGYWEPIEKSAFARTDPNLGMRWVPLMDTSNEHEAMALVNYMNGGDGKKFVWND
jgi:hypothetical protein